jgi:hypothetical protein
LIVAIRCCRRGARVVDDLDEFAYQRVEPVLLRLGRRQRGVEAGRRSLRHGRGHVVARLGPRLDAQPVLEHAVGGHRGGHADLVLLAELAHRRQAVAALQRAGLDRGVDLFGDALVARQRGQAFLGGVHAQAIVGGRRLEPPVQKGPKAASTV